MASEGLDITIVRNRDYLEVLSFQAVPTDAHGDPLDFWDGGWSGAAQARTHSGAEEVLLEIAVDLTVALEIELRASHVATAEVDREGFWDLALTRTSDGWIESLVTGGRMFFEEDYTDA